MCLYSLDCWSGEPDHRPTINQVVAKLKAIIMGENTKDSQSCDSSNEQLVSNDNVKMISKNSDSSCGSLSKLIQNFDIINTNELDFTILLSEQIKGIYEIFDKGIFEASLKQEISNYFNTHDITLQQIYNWLLNNQNDTNSIFLLGIFSYLGIEMDINNQKAFELFQKVADLGNALFRVLLSKRN